MPPLPTVTVDVLVAVTVRVLTTLAAIVAATPLMSSATPPSAVTARGSALVAAECTVAPAVSIADVPWPQQRYDLDALSQITDGTGIVVAVVDSGVDAVHPQLLGRVLAGVDLLAPAGDGRLDCVGHGTAVASIIAAGRRPDA